MATIHINPLPSNNTSIATSSFSKHNIFRSRRFKLPRASTLRVQSKNPQPIQAPISRSVNYTSLSPERDPQICQCLDILNSKDVRHSGQIHAWLVKLNAFQADSFIGNKLAISYCKNKESLDSARKLFDEIPERTLHVYAALIGAYCRSEKWGDLFSVFRLMADEGILPNKYLVPTILKACSAMRMLGPGKTIHGFVLRNWFFSDIFVGNALIDFYANCGDLRTVMSVFDSMCERDVVSWTTLVSAYMDEGLLNEATEVFHSMELNGLKPDLISWNALASGFARNGEVDLALQCLEEMQEQGVLPRVNSWNGLISGFVQNGFLEDSFDTFNKMLLFPENPNVVTIASIVPACAGLKDLNLGKAVHAYALKCKLCKNIHVEGSLIDMYSKCGSDDHADRVFSKAEYKNIAMWNEIIAAYVNQGQVNKAVEFCISMQHDGLKPDVITCNTLLSGYARSGRREEAYKLLTQMINIDFKPNVVSLNVLVSGFQQSGLAYEALKLFQAMQCNDEEMIVFPARPNAVTFTAALSACADLNLRRKGKEIHGFLLRSGFDASIYVSSALIDMYSKCNDVGSAIEVFRTTKDRNTICWNAMIAGYVKNLQPEAALELFREMLVEGIKPSSVTFSILVPVCIDISALGMGSQLHSNILKSGLAASSNNLESILSGMYAKSGSCDYVSRRDIA